jgi:hypothetical protein
VRCVFILESGVSLGFANGLSARASGFRSQRCLRWA